MISTLRLLGLLGALSLVACSEQREQGHAHEAKAAAEQAGEDSAAGGNEQGHGHGGGTSITHYTSDIELFVEFPPFVVGQQVAFAAHLTRLEKTGSGSDRAVAEGTLHVMLTGGGAAEERATSGVSGTPGIFRPVLTPKHPGKRTLVFHLVAPGIDSVHELGEVQVHAGSESAESSLPPKADEAGAIGFTKEQQWNTDFATRPVVQRTLRESVAVMASIRPRAGGEARISAPSAGLLKPVGESFARVGMRVVPGQTLAFLTPQVGAETDAATLQLAVERARINVEHTERELRRLEGLLHLEAVPGKRVEEARSAHRLAQAELNAAKDRVSMFQGGGGGIALKAPVRGTVVDVAGSPGAAVQAGQMLVHIADLRRLWIEARVAETDLGRIDKPDGIAFKTDEQNSLVLEVGRNARSVAFGGLVDPTTRTVPVIFEFDNPGEKLKAGMHVRGALFTGKTEQTVAIPASAVVDDNGQSVVYIQRDGESFERRVVALGLRDGDWLAVRAGVKSGERVVTLGAYQVRLAAMAPAEAGHGHAH